MSTWPPPSNLADTETMQPWSFGSLRVVVALGAKDFEVDAVASSAVMMTMVAVCVLAFATVTTGGALGVDALFAAREGFPELPVSLGQKTSEQAGSVRQTP